MRIVKIILLYISIQNAGFSQQLIKNIDSVKQLVNVKVHDSTSIDNLLYLSYLHGNIDPLQSIAYADTVIAITQSFPYDEAYFKSFYLKAKTHLLNDQYYDAKLLLDKVLPNEKLKKYPDVYCDCLRSMGSYHYWNYNYSDAIDFYQASVKIGKDINDLTCNGGSLYNIAQIYNDMGNDSMAMLYYLKALENVKGSTKDNMVSFIYNGIASISDNYNEKKAALDSSLVYAKRSNNPMSVKVAYRDIAYAMMEQKDYAAALLTYEKVINTDINAPPTLENAEDFMCIAMLYMLQKKQKKARNAFQKSKEITLALQQEPNELNYFYHQAIYAELNSDYKNSIALFKKYIELADKINEENIQNVVAKKDAQFRVTESQEKILAQEVKIQKQQVSRLRLLLGSIFLLLIIGLLFQFLFQKQKQEKKAAEFALALQTSENEALKHLDRLKTQFFSNLSHELRTPLTLIVGPLENTLQKVKGKAIQDDIQLARRNSKRLLDLVNSILDFSKLEVGKLEFKGRPTPINSFLKRIVTSFDSITVVKGIQLKFESTIEDQAWAILDRDKIEKVIINLVSNAIKFTSRNGIVEFKVELNNLKLLFEVLDTGSGIYPEDLPNIFNRFYQSKRKDYPTQGGTGIGLALAKELVIFMEGSIEVTSTVGVGSAFQISLPIELTDANEEYELSSEEIEFWEGNQFEPLFIQGKKPEILIVEDHPEMSKYIEDLLSKDYHCTIAPDGMIAYQKLQEKTFDLVTCDVMMPNLDGFELREQLNTDARLKQIPFILVTARALEADKLKGLHLGVDDYITKPFSGKELTARVYNLIQNKMERLSFSEEKEADEIDINQSYCQTFLSEVEQVILENLENANFKVDDLALRLNYSRRQLGRIIQKEIGLSLVALILEIRLQKARQLLETQQYATVKEIQYKVGIESASYFTTKFTQRFGKNPKDYF